MEYKPGDPIIYNDMKGRIVRIDFDPDTSMDFFLVSFAPGNEMSLREGEFERYEKERSK